MQAGVSSPKHTKPLIVWDKAGVWKGRGVGHRPFPCAAKLWRGTPESKNSKPEPGFPGPYEIRICQHNGNNIFNSLLAWYRNFIYWKYMLIPSFVLSQTLNAGVPRAQFQYLFSSLSSLPYDPPSPWLDCSWFPTGLSNPHLLLSFILCTWHFHLDV